MEAVCQSQSQVLARQSDAMWRQGGHHRALYGSELKFLQARPAPWSPTEDVASLLVLSPLVVLRGDFRSALKLVVQDASSAG